MSNERVLIYPGCGKDITPLLLVTRDRRICKKYEKACSKDRYVDLNVDIMSVLDKVDRFVFFDMSPYFISHNIEILCKVYPTFDHFLKYIEVFLKRMLKVVNFVHHEEENYFECDFGKNKHLEWHYKADFFNISSPRLSEMVDKANVVYYHGFIHVAYTSETNVYNFTPNIDTALMQEDGTNRWDQKRKHEDKFENACVLIVPTFEHFF